MSVNTPNTAYDANLLRWQMMHDVCSGSSAVKAKGARYLPPNCSCDTEEERNSYQSYKERAVFYPVTKDTLQSNIGVVFSEDPSFNPDTLEFLKDDADGSGKSIYQIFQTALGDLLRYGRGGFFVDYPSVADGTSLADVAKGIRPTVVFYDAFSIINWRVKKVGGNWKTSLIVLSEKSLVQSPMDEFAEEEVINYRVLRLDENNQYSQQLYQTINGVITPQEVFYPTNAKGQRWDFIPFQVIGSQSNDFTIDEIPLEPLAVINLAHYINSADYENSVHICGQVQPVLSELTEDWRDFLVKNGIKLGSNSPLLLPEGGRFEYISADIEMVAKEAMDGKMQYMGALGAKVIDKAEGNVTATQVNSEDMKGYSTLSLCVANLNEASENILKWCADFFGSGYDAIFSIKQDFARGEITLDMLKFFQSEVVARRMSAETLHEIVTTGKVPELSFEEEQERIESGQNGVMMP